MPLMSMDLEMRTRPLTSTNISSPVSPSSMSVCPALYSLDVKMGLMVSICSGVMSEKSRMSDQRMLLIFSLCHFRSPRNRPGVSFPLPPLR